MHSNHPTPKDVNSETEKMIKLGVQESTPVALPREIERESEKDPSYPVSVIMFKRGIGDNIRCQ